MGLLKFYGKSVSTGKIVPSTSLLVRFQDMVSVRGLLVRTGERGFEITAVVQ